MDIGGSLSGMVAERGDRSGNLAAAPVRGYFTGSHVQI